MLSNKLVLPNFLKALTIAAFTLGSMNAIADDHGDAKKKMASDKKIVELKEMSTDTTTLTAEETVADADAAADSAEEAVSDEKMEALEDASSSLTSDE